MPQSMVKPTTPSPKRPTTRVEGPSHGSAPLAAPDWQTKSLVVLATLAVFYTLYFAKAVLMPITLALLFNLVLKPVVTGLKRFGVPDAVSATLIFLLAVGMLGGAAFYLAEPAQDWLARTPRSLDQIGERLREWSAPLEQIEKAQQEVSELTQSSGERSPVPVTVEQPALASRVMTTTGSMLASVCVTLSLLFFLLAAGDRFLEKSVEVAPTRRAKREVVDLMREIERRISRYLGAITLINLGLGTVIGLGLWMIGMPNPLLWGVLAMLLNYIPFAGLMVGTVVVGLAALVSFDTLGHALLAPLIYVGANGVEANLITPYFVGRSSDLNPVVILLAVFLVGWVWGIIGIFLAVPLLIATKIYCENHPSLKPIATYLSP